MNRIIDSLWLALGVLPFTFGMAAAENPSRTAPGVQRQEFGKTAEGAVVEVFILTNSKGITAKVMSYGATLIELHVPDRQGKLADVVLGLDDCAGYLKGHPAMGSTVGRFANRIGGAQFTLNGVVYPLAKNSGKHSIHGGPNGFMKRVWQGSILEQKGEAAVCLTYVSADGEEGFPGKLTVTVTYRLTDKNELIIEYTGVSDKDTVINLTNHSYFNLAGHDAGDVLAHMLRINADRYTVVDDALIPTGKIAPVKGTPLDFTAPHTLGERIQDLPKTKGYDHNYVLNHDDSSLILAARVQEPKSGRVMEVWTTEPGMQVYTANGMKNFKGKRGAVYQPYAGVCFETQHYPDSVNKPNFPSTTLKAGTQFRSETQFKFSVE